MSNGYRNLTGTFDILPEAYSVDGSIIPGSATWVSVESRIRAVMDVYGFREIRTPIMEPTELIARGVGQDTDIVSKEMFAFERGKTRYVLRPEMTAPVMRSYLQHSLDQKGGVQKLYYIGPCFRAERPQKGRYRQFHQFGVELIGVEEPASDVESIAVMMQIYDTLGVRDSRLRINSLGDASCRPRYRQALVDYFQPLEDQLSEISRQRLQTNPLRILDTKNEAEKALLKNAPRLPDFLDEESIKHFNEVKTRLDDIGLPFYEDPMLVRGLDYYSRTTFELESPMLGAQSALAGGGRYDLLAKDIGSKKPVPAIGFAAGFERLFIAMNAAGEDLKDVQQTDVYVVALGDDAQRWAQRVATSWRAAGNSVQFDLMGRSMKAQMREANRLNATRVVIVGSDELASGKVVLKEMETGQQEDVTFGDLDQRIKQ
jgi:histidyl-tRNA synthetase